MVPKGKTSRAAPHRREHSRHMQGPWDLTLEKAGSHAQYSVCSDAHGLRSGARSKTEQQRQEAGKMKARGN